MPRGRETDARSHIEITLSDGDVLPLMLVLSERGPDVQAAHGPASAPFGTRDLIDDVSGGMGYTTARRKGTYSHGANLWLRDGKTPMPAGKLTEVDLTPIFTPSAKGALTAAFEQNSNLYLVGGRYGYKIPAGIGAPVLDANFDPTGTTGFAATSVCRLASQNYIGGTGGPIWKLSSAGAWSQSADVIRPLLIGVYWVVAGDGGWRMVGTNADNTAYFHIKLSSTVEPMTHANWSPAAPTPIGEQSFPCRSLVNLEDTVYFVMSNGVMLTDSRGNNTRNLTPHWLKLYDDNNGYFSLPYNGSILLGHYLGLERLYTNGPIKHIPHSINPGEALGLSNETAVFGRPVAGVQHAGGVMVAFYNGADSHVLWGREVGDTFVWHGPEASFAGQRVTLMHISNLSSANNAPRVWYGTTSTATPLRLWWQSLPKWGTPLQDLALGGPHRFAESFSITFTALSGSDPLARKTLIGIETLIERLGASTQAVVYADADHTGAVLQGATNTPGYTFIGPSDPASSGNQIALRIDGVGTDTNPPVVRAVAAWLSEKQRQVYEKVYAVLFSWRQQTLHGAGLDDADPYRLFERFCQLPNEAPITLRDEFGDVWTADILGGIEVGEKRAQAGGPEGEPHYAVTATFRVRMLEKQSVTYDTGYLYDDGNLYAGGS